MYRGKAQALRRRKPAPPEVTPQDWFYNGKAKWLSARGGPPSSSFGNKSLDPHSIEALGSAGQAGLVHFGLVLWLALLCVVIVAITKQLNPRFVKSFPTSMKRSPSATTSKTARVW